MEAPKCKLCGAKHLLSESHVFLSSEPIDYFAKNISEAMPVVAMPQAAEVNKEWETRKHCPTCTCKRVYKTAAERQKAYRERHKSKP